jgi:hypothetical protein
MRFAGGICLVLSMAYQGGAVDIVLNCTAVLSVVQLDELILPLVRPPVVFSRLLLEQDAAQQQQADAADGPNLFVLFNCLVLYFVLQLAAGFGI